MIRDNNKIFGEKNDPNTVLATGTLEENQIIVGSGNKGIKTLEYNGDEAALLYLNADGKASVLPITMDGFNKAIGTDASGNLVFKDLPQTSSTSMPLVLNTDYTDVGVSFGDTKLTDIFVEGVDNVYTISVTNLTSNYIDTGLTIYLKGNFSVSGERRIVLAITTDFDIDDYVAQTVKPEPIWILGEVNLATEPEDESEIYDLLLADAPTKFAQNIIVNKCIYPLAGGVGAISIVKLRIPANSTRYIRFTGCIM